MPSTQDACKVAYRAVLRFLSNSNPAWVNPPTGDFAATPNLQSLYDQITHLRSQAEQISVTFSDHHTLTRKTISLMATCVSILAWCTVFNRANEERTHGTQEQEAPPRPRAIDQIIRNGRPDFYLYGYPNVVELLSHFGLVWYNDERTWGLNYTAYRHERAHQCLNPDPTMCLWRAHQQQLYWNNRDRNWNEYRGTPFPPDEEDVRLTIQRLEARIAEVIFNEGERYRPHGNSHLNLPGTERPTNFDWTGPAPEPIDYDISEVIEEVAQEANQATQLELNGHDLAPIDWARLIGTDPEDRLIQVNNTEQRAGRALRNTEFNRRQMRQIGLFYTDSFGWTPIGIDNPDHRRTIMRGYSQDPMYTIERLIRIGRIWHPDTQSWRIPGDPGNILIYYHELDGAEEVHELCLTNQVVSEAMPTLTNNQQAAHEALTDQINQIRQTTAAVSGRGTNTGPVPF
jgi:hypothetical protein